MSRALFLVFTVSYVNTQASYNGTVTYKSYCNSDARCFVSNGKFKYTIYNLLSF